MTELNLYLARHGQTFFNLEDKLGGDSELTPKGIEHAEKISKWLNQYKIDIIYCSPLKRSVQTAEILHKYHQNTPLIKLPELTEVSAGDMDSLTYSEFEKNFPELFKARKNDKYHWVFPNGESYETARQRISPFLDKLRSKKGNFVIIGHQGINRIILGYLLNLPKEETLDIVIPNDVIFEIDLKVLHIHHIKDEQRIKGYIVSHIKTADV